MRFGDGRRVTIRVKRDKQAQDFQPSQHAAIEVLSAEGVIARENIVRAAEKETSFVLDANKQREKTIRFPRLKIHLDDLIAALPVEGSGQTGQTVFAKAIMELNLSDKKDLLQVLGVIKNHYDLDGILGMGLELLNDIIKEEHGLAEGCPLNFLHKSADIEFIDDQTVKMTIVQQTPTDIAVPTHDGSGLIQHSLDTPIELRTAFELKLDAQGNVQGKRTEFAVANEHKLHEIIGLYRGISSTESMSIDEQSTHNSFRSVK